MAEGVDIQFKKRFARNLLSNIIFFVLNIIIGLLLVPFFLDSLGTSAYGLVPLATSITTYVVLVINALNTTISRFLTIEIQRNEPEKINKTFNTALFGLLGLIVILLPFILFFAFLAPSIFDIGTVDPVDVVVLFSLVFGASLIRTWGSSFMVVLFAYNHLDKRNYVNIINSLIQLVTVILLFVIFGPSLPAIGISYFFAAIVSVIAAYFLSKNVCPVLRISPRYFSKKSFKEIGSASIWFTFNDIGFFIRMQIALVIVNLLFGPSANTEYSLAVTWSGLVASLGSLITTLFTPAIYSSYSKGDNVGMIRFSARAMKLTGFFAALCIGMVCIFAPQLLTIWVGEEFAYLAPLVCMVVIPAYFNILEGCAGTIFTAFLKIRAPTFANLATGGLNVVLAIFFASVLDMGLYGIALGSGISIFLYSVVFKMTYGAHVAGAHPLALSKSLIPGLIALACLTGFGFMVTSIITIDSIISLILAGGFISATYLFILTKFVLNISEQKIIRDAIPKPVQRFIPPWVWKKGDINETK